MLGNFVIVGIPQSILAQTKMAIMSLGNRILWDHCHIYAIAVYDCVSNRKIPRSVITVWEGINIFKALDKYYIAKMLNRKIIPIYSPQV